MDDQAPLSNSYMNHFRYLTARSFSRTILFAILLTGAGVLAGCAAIEEEAELPEGRCRNNEDCKEGHRCKATYCEDIYHPRPKIKPY